MSARNYYYDVKKLRTNACQDFIKLILREDWKEALFKQAENEIQSKSSFAYLYLDAFKALQPEKRASYSVDQMDVTLLAQIITKKSITTQISTKTKSLFQSLVSDKNDVSHSADNESEEELLIKYRLDLEDLKRFTEAVLLDKEIEPLESKRDYSLTYEKKINDLKQKIQEKLHVIHDIKNIEYVLKKIKNSTDAEKVWIEELGKYINNLSGPQKRCDLFESFVVMSSDEGFNSAHLYAADVFYWKEDFEEYVRRLRLAHESNNPIKMSTAKNIIDSINRFLKEGRVPTEEMTKLIQDLENEGLCAVERINGITLELTIQNKSEGSAIDKKAKYE